MTHDQHEAFAVADEVGVLFDGRLAQWGDPYLLYHEPNSAHVARFVGEGALISGQQLGHHVATPLGELALKDCCCLANSPSKDVRVLLRPDDVVHDDGSQLKATVIRKAFRGADFLYTLELPNGEKILSLVPSHHDHAIEEKINNTSKATLKSTKIRPAPRMMSNAMSEIKLIQPPITPTNIAVTPPLAE